MDKIGKEQQMVSFSILSDTVYVLGMAPSL